VERKIPPRGENAGVKFSLAPIEMKEETTEPPAPRQKTSGLAIRSMVCALLPFIPLTSIVAIVLASKARKQILQSQGKLKGTQLASLAMLLGQISCALGVLIVIVVPFAIKIKNRMEMHQAQSCTKSIYLCMIDFESDMANFPNDRTAREQPELASFTGTSSNRYLGQLIAGGYLRAEFIFSIKPSMGTEADAVISPPSEILKKGENGWAYVLVDDKIEEPSLRGLSNSDSGDLPLLITPLADHSGKINPKPFNNRAIVLRIDGSSRNEFYDTSNKSPLDSPAWNEKFRPVVKMPE
jgi:hypothetical protein